MPRVDARGEPLGREAARDLGARKRNLRHDRPRHRLARRAVGKDEHARVSARLLEARALRLLEVASDLGVGFHASGSDSPAAIATEALAAAKRGGQRWLILDTAGRLHVDEDMMREARELHALVTLLDDTLPHHVYRIEPQARAYTIRGDVWDYLFDLHAAAHPDNVLVPLTLEMGSWTWVKKNPRQLLSVLGPFNPMAPHRERRTLRRHLPLLSFLHRAVAAPSAWAVLDAKSRPNAERAAFLRWYGR